MSNLTYEGTILLDPQNSRFFQSIYGSHSYDTYYSVLARFVVENYSGTDTQHEGKLVLNEVFFELINYRGPVNLVIADYDIKLGQDFKDNNGNVIENGIFLKLSIKVDNDNPEINPLEKNYIDLSKIAKYKNPEDRIIDNNSFFLVKRELLSLNGRSFDAIPNQSKDAVLNGVFDSEFFFRNGKNNYKKRTDFDLEHEVDSEINVNQGDYSIRLNGGNTPTCRENKARMQYARKA